MGSVTHELLQAIEATIARARNLDMDAMLALRNAPPEQLSTPENREQRRRFLHDQHDAELTDSEIERTYERIIQGNELQDINYLQKGMIASRAVCRITFGPGGNSFATGFLITPRVLITNNHVFPDAETARTAQAQFRYERDINGNELAPVRFRLEPDRLFFTSEELDFSVVAVADKDMSGAKRTTEFGHLPLVEMTGKVTEGEWLTIIQHPAGQLKQICVRENQFLKRTKDFLWYSTDTLAGSSGSPVFSNEWYVVALHHSGVPEKRNGVIQTVLDRDFRPGVDKETDIKWKANEGVRTSRIVQTLRDKLPDHELVKPIISPAAPESAPVQSSQESSMNRIVTVQLEIGSGGEVRLLGPGAVESLAEAAKKPKGTRDEQGNIIDAPADSTFEGTHLAGYNALIGLPKKVQYEVPLPTLGPSIVGDVAPLLSDSTKHELQYEHFSIVMNKKRRLAFFSAANVSAGGRYTLSGRADKWLVDPRIEREHQIDNTYYTRNKLDRGHLTRREDLEWGDTVQDAVRSANGTCVFTNCVPQRDIFNQGKAKGVGDDERLWAGLEQYVLEHVDVNGGLSLQVFTGPIFSRSDPKYRGEKIPMEFWKVIAAIAPDGELFATAYRLSQENYVDVSDLDEAVRELPLGAYRTYQTRISEIENDTGLHFQFRKKGAAKYTPLSECDPLAKTSRRKRRGASANESFGGSDGALESFDQIVLP